MKFVVFIAVAFMTMASTTHLTVANPLPHHHDDEYSPWIRVLKNLRRRERYEQYNRENESSTKPNEDSGLTPTDSAASQTDPVSTDFLGQRPQSSNNNGNSNSYSTPDQIQKIIREAQANQQSSSSSSGSGSSRPPSQSGTSVPPQRIEQINRGVSTILNGVGSASLEQILRGSFMFTRNENVRSVANNVLDSIFGFGRTGSNGNK